MTGAIPEAAILDEDHRAFLALAHHVDGVLRSIRSGLTPTGVGELRRAAERLTGELLPHMDREETSLFLRAQILLGQEDRRIYRLREQHRLIREALARLDRALARGSERGGDADGEIRSAGVYLVSLLQMHFADERRDLAPLFLATPRRLG